MNNFTNYLIKLMLLVSPMFLFGQTTPSGQASYDLPTTLSACNNDTIHVLIQNMQGSKTATYSGNIALEIDIPGGNLVEYIANSVHSIPSGATFVSYTSNKLKMSVPLPNLGSTTKVCFVIRPDCGITSLTTLPQFIGKITYPTGFPTAPETWTSAPMNVGVAQLNHTIGTGYPFNPSVNYGESFWRHNRLTNGGFGSLSEITFTSRAHNDLVRYNALTYGYYGYTADGSYVGSSYNGGVYPISSVADGPNYKIYTYKITGAALGADGLFTPGEIIDFYENFIAPNKCETYQTETSASYTCGPSKPACQPLSSFTSTIKVQAGIPIIAGTKVTFDAADGCPNKNFSIQYKNNGTGSAAPVGNAYNVNLGFTFGGGFMKITDVLLAGTPITTYNLTMTPASQGSTFTVDIKDKLTTDPDGPGGLEDLDADGFFDDMKTGSTVTMAAKYTIPCDLACGSALHYELASYSTFTDFCRTLQGVTSTPIQEFGFRQEQPIVQETTVNYGILTTGQSETQNVLFKFKFQQFNMDLTNATAELRIRYSDKMEFETNTLKLFGVPIAASSVTIQGLNTPGNNAIDNDSMAVYVLTAAQIALLFDNTPDELSYSQTFYGCDDRQHNGVGDNWQLLIRTNQNTCSDGSTPCSFDLSCKKPYVYGSGNACGTYCMVSGMEFKRIAKTGYTDVTESTPLVTAPTKLYEQDTALMRMTNFSVTDKMMEPNGYYTALGRPDYDGRFYFSHNYSAPKGYNGQSPWDFLPTYSTVKVYQRTPNPGNIYDKGTIGALIVEAPILVGDFQSYVGYEPTDVSMSPNGVKYTYPAGQLYNLTWYCTNYASVWIGVNCPLSETIEYSNSLWSNRYYNLDGDKLTDLYYVNIGESLQRAGWTGNVGDDNFYVEMDTKWRMDPEFPWDNTNSFSFKGAYAHSGNSLYGVASTSPSSTYGGSCNDVSSNGTAVTKEHFISNPNTVYSAACGLTACHKVGFKSYAGDFFTGGEVRVPFKIDSIVVDLPTEYGITPGTITLQYNQGCVSNSYNNIVASASTGHIKFTNGAGGDFPRADDCSGLTDAYVLCYALQKNGTAAPTQYRFPIKVYGKDDFGIPKILNDSAGISEAMPVLTLTALSPVNKITDGGGCQAFGVDYLIENNTLYDAPYVYFAAQNGTSTNIVYINDGANVYVDPIDSADVASYASGKIAKLGTIKAGDKRTVRIYATATVCSDNFTVYTDFGCAYPSPFVPQLASTTIKTATVSYLASPPAMVSLPKGGAVQIANLCDNKTVEIEIRNASTVNIYNLAATLNLPAGVSIAAGSVSMKQSEAGTYTAVPSGDVVLGATSTVNLANMAPFNTPCALPGSDTLVNGTIFLKFDLVFSVCPANSTQVVNYALSAQNFCGTAATNNGVISLNYIGTATTKNNYTLTPLSRNVQMCALKNQTQTINDTLIITNIGGFGSVSGPSSGLDSVLISMPYDITHFDFTNFSVAAPFSSPVYGTNSQGDKTFRLLVPAGIAINGSVQLIMTYDIKPLIDSLCLKKAPHLCFFVMFSSPTLLECAAKSLTCNSITRSSAGTGISFRNFKCCFGSIGDYVWQDINKDGQQGTTAAEPPIPNIKVYLLDGITNKILDSTYTDVNGKYLFDSLMTHTYRIKFDLPVGAKTTGTSIGSDLTDSDIPASGLSHLISIDGVLAVTDTLRNNPHIDLGLILPVDLRLRKTVDNATPALNSNVTFKIVVRNQSDNLATGVQVTDKLNPGLFYVSSTPAGYDPITGIWNIGNLNGNDSITLSIVAQVTLQGPLYNLAEITATNEVDLDSNPNNMTGSEDDIDQVCVSTPVTLCPGTTWTASLPASLTNVRWYKDGVVIPGATSNSYVITALGSYSFTASNSSCPSGGCCPIVVTDTNCCVAPLCLPVKINK
jgi:uncharacterized repeat protein (TIGR01451 family)